MDQLVSVNLTLKTVFITMDKEMFHQTCAQALNQILQLVQALVNQDIMFHITKIYILELVHTLFHLIFLKYKLKL